MKPEKDTLPCLDALGEVPWQKPENGQLKLQPVKLKDLRGLKVMNKTL